MNSGDDAEAPLPTNEAVELAERTLAKALGHDDSAMAEGENMTLHTYSYGCQRTGCIKAQRDELRARVESDTALLRQALEGIELHLRHHERGCVFLDETALALRERLAETTNDLNRCPSCGGPADNGHDREVPPNPY